MDDRLKQKVRQASSADMGVPMTRGENGKMRPMTRDEMEGGPDNIPPMVTQKKGALLMDDGVHDPVTGQTYGNIPAWKRIAR